MTKDPVAESVTPRRTPTYNPATPQELRLTTAKVRVLIVDDSVDYSAGLAELVRGWGYTVELAHNAKAALAIAVEYRPRVVFLDLGLPDMHGYELARRMRGQAADRRIHFVVVTGWTQIADQLNSSAAGIAHHLIKPLNVDTLREILSAYQSAEEAHLVAAF